MHNTCFSRLGSIYKLSVVKFPIVDLKKGATVLPKRRHQIVVRPVSWSLFIDMAVFEGQEFSQLNNMITLHGKHKTLYLL